MSNDKQKKKSAKGFWNDVKTNTKSFFDDLGKKTEQFAASVERSGEKSKEVVEQMGKNIKEFFDDVGKESKKLMRKTKAKIEGIPYGIKNMITDQKQKIYKKEKERLRKDPKERARRELQNRDIKRIRKGNRELQDTINNTRDELIDTKRELIEARQEISETKNKLEETNEKIEETKQDIKNVIKTQINIILSYYKKRLVEEPSKYEGLVEEDLKIIMNTTIWEENKDEFENEYLKEVFSKLDQKSRDELILSRIILSFMDKGYDTCAFLLTKTIERELKLKMMKPFKNYWEQELQKKKYPNNYQKANKIMLNYLLRNGYITLGNIHHFIEEIYTYCQKRDDKEIIFGWERDFMTLFGKQSCPVLKEILQSFVSEKLTKLRNHVAHPNDIKKEQNPELIFNRDFVEGFLGLLTNKKPQLLRLICKIEPSEEEDKSKE